MFFDVIGFLLLVALLAFGVGALWKPLRALWGFISRRQALDWWTKKPILPIVRGKSGGRFKRIYRKRTRRSFYGRF